MSSMKATVVGLGAMGMGIATSALKAGLDVTGCDVSSDALNAFMAAGGKTVTSPSEAAADADLLAVVVVNMDQTEAVLFGEGGAAEALPKGAVVLGCATVPPAFARDVAARLAGMGLLYLDAPISGGAAKAAAGQITVMGSGSAEAFARARPFLDAVAEKVFELGDEAGPGSTMKMVNQLLAGVHIATAMEALALGIRSGLDADKVYEVITASAGNSWMFENRVPHVLDNDYTPKSAVEIFVKDLGIVLETGKREGFPLPVSAAAHQQFLAAKAMGLGREDDAAVIKVFAALAGIELPGGSK
ncbi:MAG: NAD-binding protein [Rhodospirillales bacterium]|nr:NAD-binding protein [Rhodospirillales bacterium]MBO6785458.1 NAD-binding protein [Rhodospirillales bacterium]